MSDRPVLGDASPSAKLTTIAATCASVLLVVLHVIQLRNAGLALVYLWLIPLAWIVADLLSGLLHWSADTWGNESTPLLGARFIRPFRVHHLNASDITKRPFFDLNGDVALGVLPILAIAFAVPASLRLFLVALSIALLPTNQIHQWAHRERVPRSVRTLQRWGIILRPEQHILHHTDPFRSHYCITSGWWNALLERTRILERVENVIRPPHGKRITIDSSGISSVCRTGVAGASFQVPSRSSASDDSTRPTTSKRPKA